ncbi:MAG: hypothetical protein KAR54_03150 [Candidatus Pacebacteria bacterium]|nr:hypothetical protein [Candidatus Paceibacterota bacterium]
MKITNSDRNKLTAYLKGFYANYPREKFTIFHYVRYFKKRLKDKKLDAWTGVCGDVGCLFGDTFIKEYSSPLKKLYQIFGNNFFPLKSYDWEIKKEVNSVGKIINSGEKKVYKLKTKEGSEIFATKDHKFFILKNGKVIEKELRSIKKGDKIVKT